MKRARSFGVILVAMAAAGLPATASAPPDPGASAQFFVGGGAVSHQGYLGVDVRDISPEQVSALKLHDGHGAEIIMVDHDAPAGKCGLREHDVLLQMNGQAIEGRDQVRRILHDLQPGRPVQLIISRDGQSMTVNTQMSSREEVERVAWEQHLTPAESQASADLGEVTQSSPGAARTGNSFLGGTLGGPMYTGAVLEKMTAQLADFFGVPSGAGLLVRSVQPNSPAALAGMHAGDVVLRAASRIVSSTGDWVRALKASRNKPVPVVVLRDKKEQTLTLALDTKKRSSVEQPADSGASRLGLSFKSKR
jgi:serine protease Do